MELLDESSIRRAIESTMPDEIYHLASESYVPKSWQRPEYVGEVNGQAVLHLLEAVRSLDRPIRFFQASSSEMYGNASIEPQDESTPLRPRSPYGSAKAFAHDLVRNYRERYGMYCVAGIMFNHESPRRPAEFVTRRVSLGVAAIRSGRATSLQLGSLDNVRDWGFAGDYVVGMHSMLQQPEPDDYVLATGRSHSIRQLCELAFAFAGLDYGAFVTEVEGLRRPNDVTNLRGNPAKARSQLGWEARTTFEDLVAMMVRHDLEGTDQ